MARMSESDTPGKETSLGRRLMRYFFGSIISTVTDIAVLWVLKAWIFSGYFFTYLFAPVLSFEIALVINFAISYHWVWRDRVEAMRCLKDFFARFRKYQLASLLVLGIKMLLLIAIERMFRFDVVLCNLIALTFTGIINFFIREHLIFGKKSAKPPVEGLK